MDTNKTQVEAGLKIEAAAFPVVLDQKGSVVWAQVINDISKPKPFGGYAVYKSNPDKVSGQEAIATIPLDNPTTMDKLTQMIDMKIHTQHGNEVFKQFMTGKSTDTPPPVGQYGVKSSLNDSSFRVIALLTPAESERLKRWHKMYSNRLGKRYNKNAATAAIETLKKMDPTAPKYSFMNWLINRHLDGEVKFQQSESINRILQQFKDFNNVVEDDGTVSSYFDPGKDRDLNSYGNIESLRAALAKVIAEYQLGRTVMPLTDNAKEKPFVVDPYKDTDKEIDKDQKKLKEESGPLDKEYYDKRQKELDTWLNTVGMKHVTYAKTERQKQNELKKKLAEEKQKSEHLEQLAQKILAKHPNSRSHGDRVILQKYKTEMEIAQSRKEIDEKALAESIKALEERERAMAKEYEEKRAVTKLTEKIKRGPDADPLEKFHYGFKDKNFYDEEGNLIDYLYKEK